MGIFTNNFNKPGKGVEKDEREKHRIFIFFDVLFRKFMKFIQLNMIYLLFSMPYLFLLYWFSPLNADTASQIAIGGISEFVKTLPTEDLATFDLVLRLLFASAVMILWGSGPASAGAEYVLRNFSREEHAWVLSDFWDTLKNNFMRSVIVLFVDILVMYLSLTAFNFYSSLYAANENNIFLIAQGLLGFILILYTLMHYYIYQLMITYDTGIKAMYKNAMLFSVIKFPQNLFFSVLVFGIVLGLYVLLGIFAVLVFLICAASICRFIIIFYTSEAIRLIENQTETGK